MFTKHELLQKYPEFTEGLKVKSRENENLGKVVSASDDQFIIEKGIFFPRDFALRYDDIQEVREGVVFLNFEKAELEKWRESDYAGWAQVEDINQGKLAAKASPEFTARTAGLRTQTQAQTAQESITLEKTAQEKATVEEQATVPLVEEHPEAQKTLHEVGSVRLRKIVHTELRHSTIPVMKEEVRIERVPAGAEASLAPEQAAFKEESIVIPIREEEVVIQKRPEVKEEVRVTKEQLQEMREVSGEIRKEDVEIERKGAAEKRKKTA